MSNLFQSLAQRAVRPAAITPRPRSLFEGPSAATPNPEVEGEIDSAPGETPRSHAEAPSISATPAILPPPARIERIETQTQISRTGLETHREEKILRETRQETREIVDRSERTMPDKVSTTAPAPTRAGELSAPSAWPRPPVIVPEPERSSGGRLIPAPQTTTAAERAPATALPAPAPLLVPNLAPLAVAPPFAREEKARGGSVTPPPAIRVTIGRVEVRADLPGSAAPAAASPRKNSPVISLEEYLRENTPQRRHS